MKMVLLKTLFMLLTLTLICIWPRAHADECGPVRAVESVIAGLPVPEGSQLDESTYYRDDNGVEMVSYRHPELSGEELLAFFDACMPLWGWEESGTGDRHRLQRAYSKDGVPVLIGADKREEGCSFNILKGVAGDWGYMAPLRTKS